ncbi:sigma-70 family RNA polymerase sigma factor [uncultured Enterovirga sp.]|uniref:sigma-70 family RNA polymerase sigma factor n=1 Tax=uncultured Enterovirga sp. TaxID=2026352 RepID=UPI0035CAFC04
MDGFDYEAALAGCARREAAALRSLYDRDAGFLAGIALRIVKRPEVASDVLHDAFLDIWRGASTYDPSRGAARAWIVSVVRHRALKAVRRSGRETELDPAVSEQVPDDTPDAFASLALSQEGAALRVCLEQLEPSRRTVILLAYVDGLSQSEIARRLGAPLGTIKAWTRRSLTSLRECLA